MLKNQKKFINIKTNLISNFKPSILNCNNLGIKTNKKRPYSNVKNQIYCKNFLIYLLLIKYKNFFFFEKSSIFIKKFKKKIYTVLRSPYRHKLARHQIHLNRYEINSSITVKLNTFVFINNWKKFLIFFNFVKSFNNIFESNIIYTNSSQIKFYVSYEKNFDFNFFN